MAGCARLPHTAPLSDEAISRESIYGDRGLLAEIDAADATLTRGEGRVITEESMRQLAWDVKQHGRARLAAEEERS